MPSGFPRSLLSSVSSRNKRTKLKNRDWPLEIPPPPPLLCCSLSSSSLLLLACVFLPSQEKASDNKHDLHYLLFYSCSLIGITSDKERRKEGEERKQGPSRMEFTPHHPWKQIQNLNRYVSPRIDLWFLNLTFIEILKNFYKCHQIFGLIWRCVSDLKKK